MNIRVLSRMAVLALFLSSSISAHTCTSDDDCEDSSDVSYCCGGDGIEKTTCVIKKALTTTGQAILAEEIQASKSKFWLCNNKMALPREADGKFFYQTLKEDPDSKMLFSTDVING